MCPVCGKVFSYRSNTVGHLQTHIDNVNQREHECEKCGKKFNREYNLQKHYLTHIVPCPKCKRHSAILNY